MGKKVKKTVEKTVAKPSKKTSAKAERVEVEVLPPEAQETGKQGIVLRHPNDMSALDMLTLSIKRDIQTVGKLEKASAMGSIKIGIALNAAKAMFRHGSYERWVDMSFGADFSKRRASYFSKIAKVFMVSEESKRLALPSPKDAGNWLIVADEGSQLAESVSEFVGDMTFAELLDKHGVRAVKPKGGYRPPQSMVDLFTEENPHLAGRDYDDWAESDKKAFKEWSRLYVRENSGCGDRIAAEETWARMRGELAQHGIDRKTYTNLTKKQLDSVYDVVSTVCENLRKAMKNGGAK